MLDDFRSDDPGRLPGRLPLAPAPRHRDDHLHARGRGRARRQPGQRGRHRPRRRAVDDRRQRHHPPGDAEGRPDGAHGRLPALGQPAGRRQDDGPALPRGLDAEDIPEVGRPTARTVKRHLRRGATASAARSATSSIEPEYLDVTLPAGSRFVHPVDAGHTVFAYVVRGGAAGVRAPGDPRRLPAHVVLFGDGDEVCRVRDGQTARASCCVSGKPLREPIAWRGPIVMNTHEELERAFAEYRDGTFVKVSVPT